MSLRALRIPFTTLALLLALALPRAAEAWPPHWGRHGGPHGERGPGGFVALHAERLGLDAQAREAIERVVAESQARDESLRDELDAAREALRARLSEASPDPDGILAQAEALGALETQAHKNRLRAMLEIRSLLTPEQRAELLQIREERRPRRSRDPLGRCSRDLEEHCAHASGLAGLSCLEEHWPELSERCRAAFDAD